MSLDLVGAVLTGVLGGRRKRSRNALRFLGHGGEVINATTLMTAAGLAWGAYEAWQSQAAPAPGGLATPLAGSSAAAQPLPVMAAPPGSPGVAAMASTVRMLRLSVAAANADGSMSDAERAAVVAQAKAEGASDAVVRELEQAGPLADIVAGLTEPGEKTALYVIAFTVIRADEQVSGSERIFLAQLANLLGLDPQAVALLEKTFGDRIDAEGASAG